MIQRALRKLVEKQDLTHSEAFYVMREIMAGEVGQSLTASFLTALRMKGETVEEMCALTSAMMEFCHKIAPKVNGRLVDTCGTGGDRIKTFNISTTAVFVAAGAGVSIAKHGNRSVTSNSGSADVLESLGVNLNVKPETVERTIEKIGVGFMFAPVFHPAMRNVAAVRKELGIRTTFNILGPLVNPARVDAQVVGVCEEALVEKVAIVLKHQGIRDAMVFHGMDGLDEISTVGKTLIAKVEESEIKSHVVGPGDFGVRRATPEEIAAGIDPMGNAELSFKIIYGVLKEGEPKRDIVLVNAAAAIIVGGKAEDYGYAMELGRESIESGAAYKKLRELLTCYEGSRLSTLEELEAKYG